MKSLLCALFGHRWLTDVSTTEQMNETFTRTFFAYRCTRCEIIR